MNLKVGQLKKHPIIKLILAGWLFLLMGCSDESKSQRLAKKALGEYEYALMLQNKERLASLEKTLMLIDRLSSKYKTTEIGQKVLNKAVFIENGETKLTRKLVIEAIKRTNQELKLLEGQTLSPIVFLRAAKDANYQLLSNCLKLGMDVNYTVTSDAISGVINKATVLTNILRYTTPEIYEKTGVKPHIYEGLDTDKVIKCILLLIEKGIKVNQADKSGMTPLFYAVQGHPEITTLLLKHGAAVNHDISNKTALSLASYGINDKGFYRYKPKFDDDGKGKDLEVVRILLEHGAMVDGVSNYQRPLINALSYGKLDIARLLLEYGANPNIKNEYSEDAIAVINNISDYITTAQKQKMIDVVLTSRTKLNND